MRTTCRLCGQRKGRRACPGVRDEICAVCCGTKRLTEIACPPDCIYLSSARTHPPAAVQRQQARDAEFLLAHAGSEAEFELLMTYLVLVRRHAQAAVPRLLDVDVAEAAAAAAATLETASKGIIYEHEARSVPAQRLAGEFGRLLTEWTDRAGAGASRLERHAAAALRQLERCARDAAAAYPDAADPQTAWLAAAGRLLDASGQPGEAPEAPAATREPSRIIMP
ncbi:MAG TPA: hypothetical protein VFX12_08000 [Vicinamibacterales bacterium]|nr:hypothetical protein [Vicinamibacterales bacterium]